MAIEAAGLSVSAAKEILRHSGKLNVVQVSSENELRDTKRKKQARDIENVQAGRIDARSMSWFTAKQARGAKIKNAPY